MPQTLQFYNHRHTSMHCLFSLVYTTFYTAFQKDVYALFCLDFCIVPVTAPVFMTHTLLQAHFYSQTSTARRLHPNVYMFLHPHFQSHSSTHFYSHVFTSTSLLSMHLSYNLHQFLHTLILLYKYSCIHTSTPILLLPSFYIQTPRHVSIHSSFLSLYTGLHRHMSPSTTILLHP